MNALEIETKPRGMRHVVGSALVDFADFYDETVEVVSVHVPPSEAVLAASHTLLSRPGLQMQWVQGASTSGDDSNASRSKIDEALTTLRTGLELPVEMLQELLGCASCGVRIKVLEGPMCPRFHVDQVACRLLITYAGPGTEWIANSDCDAQALKAGDANPVRPGGEIQQAEAGAWLLLKGGKWSDGFKGVVHRSPSTSERRLLVSIDPIFSDG